MKMTGRKATVFITLESIFTTALILSIFFAKESLNIFGSAIISAMVLIGIAFIGGNTFDKYIRSKQFKRGFDEKIENDIQQN